MLKNYGYANWFLKVAASSSLYVLLHLETFPSAAHTPSAFSQKTWYQDILRAKSKVASHVVLKGALKKSKGTVTP